MHTKPFTGEQFLYTIEGAGFFLLPSFSVRLHTYHPPKIPALGGV